MVFSSVLFLGLFFPIVFLLYAFANNAMRTYILLVASLFFYSWGEPKALFVMLGVILVDYIFALIIGRDNISTGKKKLILALGIIVNLSALFVYKYLSFAIGSINPLLSRFGITIPDPLIPLPVGISFYIFQSMSYIIDVYRKEVPAQRNIATFALYVSLFPQLIAGPIVRYTTIVADFCDRNLHLDNIYFGIQRFIIGLAKKVLIADSMAFIADKVFNAPVAQMPSFYCWLGAIAYTLQIYYDFSGYSDMAIGIGRVFNFRFLENFNYPYSAKSVQDFWRRWHISLSTWFRDYLYIPLGGNRKGKFMTYFNSFIVFFLCGLWHGAAWTFVLWGIYHGLALVIEKLGLGKKIEKLPRVLTTLYVWLFAIIGWVLFRANSISDAGHYLKNMFLGNPNYPVSTYFDAIYFMTFSNLFMMLIGIFLSFPVAKWNKVETINPRVKMAFSFVLFVITLVFSMTSNYSPFIYFRF